MEPRPRRIFLGLSLGEDTDPTKGDDNGFLFEFLATVATVYLHSVLSGNTTP